MKEWSMTKYDSDTWSGLVQSKLFHQPEFSFIYIASTLATSKCIHSFTFKSTWQKSQNLSSLQKVLIPLQFHPYISISKISPDLRRHSTKTPLSLLCLDNTQNVWHTNIEDGGFTFTLLPVSGLPCLDIWTEIFLSPIEIPFNFFIALLTSHSFF